MLRRTVKKYPDSLCYDFQGNCATYQEAEKFINSLSNFLVENGVKKGDRVAISLPNLPQFIVALFGTFSAGCVASGINFLLSPKEITYQLKDCGAVAIVTLDSFYEEKVREAL
ncbi:MAG: AMP-binding protein, partial [Promethearchaeota archaeon]